MSSKRVVLSVLLFLVIGATLRSAIYAQPGFNPIPARVTKARSGLIRLLNQVPYGRDFDNPNGKAALVFDDQYAFVSSPGGLYRTPLPLTPQSSFSLIGFQNTNIFNLYVDNGLLYVLKESVANQGASATDHSFLRSDDHGDSFLPLDGSLQECLSGFCEFLSPTQAIFKNGLIFINAGAGSNLFVSANNGVSWTALLGSFHRMLANSQAIELANRRVLVGGETAGAGYLQSGILGQNLLGWKQVPSDVASPDLQNRGPLVIRSKPNTSDIYAGIPGGLLKSADGGQPFKYAIGYPLFSSNLPFPYISSILFPSGASNVIVVAGRDPDRPYLAYSKDNGETWLDVSARVSYLVADSGAGQSSIDSLTEDSHGNVFASVLFGPTRTLKILQVQFNSPMFR